MALKFFVSYTQKDRPWAEWIAWQIEHANHEVRLQAWDFTPGTNFVHEMDEALQWADVTLPILSPDFMQSDFGKAEWMSALAKDPLGTHGSLIPIRVREVKPDGLLRARVYVDLVGLRQDAARETVLAALKKGRRKPDSEPPFPGELPASLEKPPQEEPRFPRRVPAYSSQETKSLADQLEDAQQRLKEQVQARQNTDAVRQEIRSLKRRIREGGSVEAGECLGDGRFELLDRIGQGGFAHVWRAWDTEQNEEVAIKVLQSRHKQNAKKLDRFQRGARQMARLSHPGIVRVIGEPQEDHGYHFFVMEYLEGGDFRQAVKSGRLSLEDRWRVLLSIGEALQHAHDEGIIHRDVKPENILLDSRRNRAKLTDFDLVRASGQSGGTTSMLGSFVYAAPEMLDQPRKITRAVDVFGLGMTAIFALHGDDLPPLAFRNAETFLASIGCAELLARILGKAVEWEIGERWKTVETFSLALDGALKAVTGPRISGSAPPKKSPNPAKQVPRIITSEIPELGDSWKDRIEIYARLPDQFDNPEQLLDLLDQLRRKTRSGNDLFHLELTVEEVAKKWAAAAVPAAELRSRLYDHIPQPPEELFQRIETKDGRVDLWRMIPAGSFLMGSPNSDTQAHSDERPLHRVDIIRSFQMACVPVTQAQFAAFDPDHSSNHDGEQHPVEQVTWFQSVAFCNWLSQAFPWAKGARLPIEVEWEYACRAGTTTRYWSGDGIHDLNRVGWSNRYSGGRTQPVGKKDANGWGLYDVHGNVWEWTLSGWTNSYEKHAQGREIDPTAISHDKPTQNADLLAPAASSWRVVRGGSDWLDAYGERSAYRNGVSPEMGSWLRGFRVALPRPAQKASGLDLRESRE